MLFNLKDQKTPLLTEEDKVLKEAESTFKL
jgi:hypothetical protein